MTEVKVGIKLELGVYLTPRIWPNFVEGSKVKEQMATFQP
jgi:hypothetical protein